MEHLSGSSQVRPNSKAYKGWLRVPWLCVYAAGLDARSGKPNFVKEFSKTLLYYTR